MSPSFPAGYPSPLPRAGPRLGGVGFDGSIPFVTSLGLQPLAEAVQYRIFKAFPAVVDRRSFENTTALMGHQTLLGGFPQVEPWDTWRWLSSMKCSRRRKILIKAWHAMKDRGSRHRLFARISPFVKTENLPWFAIIDGMCVPEAVRYVARLIQAPHDETHIIAGPYLKPLTLALKERWDYRNWIFYASATPEKLDSWLRANSHRQSFFWSDYSAFDATWTKHSWAMIEDFYRRVFPDAEELREVLDVWRCPEGVAHCRKEGAKLWYRSDEANASGRDDTALANALFNGLALAMAITAAYFGLEVHQVTETMLAIVSQLCNIAIVGDDSLVCCDFDATKLKEVIQENLQSFGLVVKAECSLNLWDVTFLGCMPYDTDQGLFWGPTIGRRMYKAFWQSDPKGHLPAWTKGVAKQLALHKHVPVVSDLAERVLQLLDGQPATDLFDENKPYHSRSEATVKWSMRTLEWMCRRYPGLSPGMVTRDCEVIRGIARLPAVMHSETFLVCVAQDDL